MLLWDGQETFCGDCFFVPVFRKHFELISKYRKDILRKKKTKFRYTCTVNHHIVTKKKF
jgi:hypothetical protein